MAYKVLRLEHQKKRQVTREKIIQYALHAEKKGNVNNPIKGIYVKALSF